jgi:hypothetical protein
MRWYLSSLVCIGIVAIAMPAAAADRQDELFASWKQAQRDVRSLVVEFTLETQAIWHTTEQYEGTFKLVRTPEGEIFASHDIAGKKPGAGQQERWGGLLNGGRVYLLDYDKKLAIKFEPAESELPGFLEKYFNPFVVLLDQKRAEEKCRLEVVKQDEWYTYLAVKSKDASFFRDARAVLMNSDTDNVPKNMPRQLWWNDGNNSHAFQIRAWRLNASDAPKPEEFTKPEDRPGWEVTEWSSLWSSFWGKKR